MTRPYSRRHDGSTAAGASAWPGARDLDVTLSLAGRTASPARKPVPVRSGGFGGAAGLADYLAASASMS